MEEPKKILDIYDAKEQEAKEKKVREPVSAPMRGYISANKGGDKE